jgi:hypothetical protein
MTEQSTAPAAQAGEKEILLERLRQGRERYLRNFDAVNENHVSWNRSDGTWSIVECAEHVAVAEEQMLRLWEKLAAPGTTDRAKDAKLLATAHDRSHKAQAPERSRPTGRVRTLQEALDRFNAARDRTLAFVAAIPVEELRSKVVSHPLAGDLDGYQLFTLMALHPERHGLQVQEIMYHPEFPGSSHP